MINESLTIAPLQTRRSRLMAGLRAWRGSLIFVGLPTLLATLYYGLFAADLYASEAEFVVHSPGHGMVTSGLAGLLQTGSLGGGGDVYSVQEFAVSRDAITALSKRIGLREMFAVQQADALSRFPNFVDDGSDEDFYRYFQHRVDVVYDTTTGLSKLTVKAFRAQDAQALARLILDESEALVNRLNERSRANAVRDAEALVADAQKQITDAEQNLLNYRNRESLLDPGETSGAMFKNLAALQSELSTSRVRLSDIERRSPDSPARAELQQHIQALEQQIASQRSHLAGDGESMAPKLSEYQLLQLRQEFASKQLASALGSLELARSEARRQQIYLDRVVEPSLPDKALYPQRGRDILIVLVSSFLIYSIARLLLAGVREHAQQ